ncbi:MAG: hypothetical protein M3P98_03380 [bacterium]|nr:hypothetical protein [bacterium]
MNKEKQVKKLIHKNKLVYFALAVLVLIFLVGGIYGYLYKSTPSHIRYPKFEHYHFRTQIIVDGNPVDFSKDEFQNETPGTCSIDPGGTPIDFHDNVDQLTHIHWDGMTGGEFLKYFGWNFIGGSDDNLGRRYDDGLMSMQTVNRYGDLLPDIPEDTNFYLYIGDENGYEKKDWNDFLESDLEEFFGKNSNLNQDEQTSLLEKLFFPKAYAHGDKVDKHNEESDKSEEELKRINNLIGNVVIFVQNDEPTDEQIQARFDNLVPLHESICGG